MSSPRLLLIALGALALVGCDVRDDGPRTTQTRDLAEFTRVDNHDSVDVRLRVGERQRVRVRAGEKVIDDVHTEVRDGVLEVSFDEEGWGDSDVVVEASVPRLTAVAVTGSGDLEADGIDAEALEVELDGSGEVELAGTADRLAVLVDGSGEADLAELAARDVRLTVGGSGDAEVRADDRLDVTVDGSGDVRYHGDPTVNQRVDGSGDLSRAG